MGDEIEHDKKSSDFLLRLYREMLRIRIIEEGIADLYPEQEMRCPVHLSIGQEAAAVGTCAALKQADFVLSGHRSHSHYLAKGGNLRAMMAEIYGKASGCSGGKGGSMHLIDRAAGFLGATPIVGSTIPIAAGVAHGSRMKGEDRVTVTFFGDGATEAGVFHESLDFAVLKQLPLVFVCENNLYSVYSPMNVRQSPKRNIVEVARSHGIESVEADGNDVERVFQVTRDAVASARAGGGPVFLEFSTYRWREHCGPNYDNDIGYRSETEFLEWREQCPVTRMERKLLSTGAATPEDVQGLKAEIHAEFMEAIAFAKNSPFPSSDALMKDILAPTHHPPEETPGGKTRELKYAKALQEAQEICLAKDPNVYVMGLGVPDPKGIFGTTVGLQEKFGAERVFDIPLSENALTGVAIGSALVGMRPVLTHQRVDFALIAMEQMINQGAKWFYMFGGQAPVPMVIRMVIGRGWGQGPQHSQSLQSIFAHIPGLRVVMPTTAHDAKGMLIAAIEDNNPVIFLEHRWLHDITDTVPAGHYRVPLDKARVMKEGHDVTLACTSYMTLEGLNAAETLAKEGISAEVVDLRSIRPLDKETLLASVCKTGRILVADTGWKAFGVSAEVIALIVESEFSALKAPPARVALPDTPSPTSPALAADFFPRAPHIVAAVLRMFGRQVDESILEPPEGMNLDQPDPSFTGPF